VAECEGTLCLRPQLHSRSAYRFQRGQAPERKGPATSSEKTGLEEEEIAKPGFRGGTVSSQFGYLSAVERKLGSDAYCRKGENTLWENGQFSHGGKDQGKR